MSFFTGITLSVSRLGIVSADYFIPQIYVAFGNSLFMSFFVVFIVTCVSFIAMLLLVWIDAWNEKRAHRGHQHVDDEMLSMAVLKE